MSKFKAKLHGSDCHVHVCFASRYTFMTKASYEALAAQSDVQRCERPHFSYCDRYTFTPEGYIEASIEFDKTKPTDESLYYATQRSIPLHVDKLYIVKDNHFSLPFYVTIDESVPWIILGFDQNWTLDIRNRSIDIVAPDHLSSDLASSMVIDVTDV